MNREAINFLNAQMTELETMNLEDDLEDDGEEVQEEITLAFILIDQTNLKVDCQGKLEKLEHELDLQIKNDNISKQTVYNTLRDFCLTNSYDMRFDPRNRFADLVDLWYSRKCENYGISPK